MLDYDPVKCAQMHVSKHILKMLIETKIIINSLKGQI